MLRKTCNYKAKVIFFVLRYVLKAQIQLRYLMLVNTAIFIQTSKHLIWRVLNFNLAYTWRKIVSVRGSMVYF